MAELTINNPSSEALEAFRQRHYTINNWGLDSQAKAKKYLAIGLGWMVLLNMAFNWSVNPIGSNRRLRYTKNLSPIMRFTRRYLPLATILSGLVYYDIQDGVW